MFKKVDGLAHLIRPETPARGGQALQKYGGQAIPKARLPRPFGSRNDRQGNPTFYNDAIGLSLRAIAKQSRFLVCLLHFNF